MRIVWVLLLLPVVAGVSDLDPADDVTVDLVTPTHAPEIDLLEVSFTSDGDVSLSLQINGTFLQRPDNATNSYVWAVDSQGQEGALIANADFVVQCTMPDLQCRISKGPGALLGVVANQDNLTVRASSPLDFSKAVVGGAATRMVDGTVTAQDFTPRMEPFTATEKPVKTPIAPVRDSPAAGLWPLAVVLLAWTVGYRAWSGK